MENQHLEIKTALQILKPFHEVFEAVVNPERMSGYFISRGSGRMEEGRKLISQFPEFYSHFPIRVDKVIPDKHCVLLVYR